MARMWSEILRIDRVGIHDNFFELGGDSLQAAILLNQLTAAVGRHFSLPLRDVFESRTIATLSGRIEAALQGDGAALTGGIPRAPRQPEMPLSLNQESLWFLGRLEPERPSYMLYLALNVKGPLSIPTLEHALNGSCSSARDLANQVSRGGRPSRAGDRAPQVPLLAGHRLEPVAGGGARSRAATQDRRSRWASRSTSRMDRWSAWSCCGGRKTTTPWPPACTTSSTTDGPWAWCSANLRRSIRRCWPAAPSPLPELPIQFADYAVWQRNCCKGRRSRAAELTGDEQLADVPPLELPTDYPRPAIRTTRGSSRPCQLSPATSAAVLEFCRREGATPFMVLLAAFEVLLGRYSGQDDFAVGTPVANRNRPEIGIADRLLGQRGRIAGGPRRRPQLPRSGRAGAAGGVGRLRASGDDPGSSGRCRRPPRDLSRNPIFQVMFALHNCNCRRCPIWA